MKILITGAGGFVGSAVAAEFSNSADEAILTFRKRLPEALRFPAKNCYTADLTDSAEVSRLGSAGEADAVIHAAGLAHQFGPVASGDFQKVNVLGTRNVLDLAGRLSVKHFILISSVAVYGRRPHRMKRAVTEAAECSPDGPYAESKLAAEKAAIDYCAENEMRLTILRPATVIGEGDRGNVRRLIESIDKKQFRWIGNGKNHKSLIYKNDLAKACRHCLEGETNSPAIFNVAGGSLEMREIVSIIASELGRRLPPVRIPSKPLKIALRSMSYFRQRGRIATLLETIDKWTADDVYSADSIADVFGFRPETSVAEALRRQVAAYKRDK